MKIAIPNPFKRAEAVFGEASPRDASALARLHAASFRRGWSDGEVERLLLDRQVVAHRVKLGAELAGFILSRMAAGEAEILSVAVAKRRRSRGLARRLLDLHLRRLAGLGVKSVFLEVEQSNLPALRLYHRAGFEEIGRRDGYYPRDDAPAVTALVLRRDLS